MIPRERWPYWIGGIVVALAGVLLVRVVAVQIPTAMVPLVRTAGFVLSLLGLCVIALGTRRGAKRKE